ncbi:MAG TPA: hypothetical protein VF992_04590 [Thermoplasmata archaeon]
MTEKRILALLAMLIGLIGGLLILVGALGDLRGIDLTGNLTRLANLVIATLLGIAIILGSLMIYRGKYGSGGIINIVLGIIVIVLSLGSSTGGILAIVSGVLGLVAAEAGK